MTTLPRWTREPGSGVGRHEAAVPDELATALEQLADRLGVPLDSLLLAAHAKVLSALTSEPQVTTGYVPATGGAPHAVRLTVEPGPWRALAAEAGAANPGAGSSFEAVLDLGGGADGDLPDGLVLSVGVRRATGLTLELRFRLDVLDGAAASRIAGYLVTALRLLTADPEADHSCQSLLSDEETRFQLDGLAGRRRALPDRRAHELFEERVRAHPDRVAAVHEDRRWTYAELNDRSNRLARALLARGLAREDVVGVVTERNLDWMAAVLAVFKAGGAYLPIEPHFPADRIARTLSRADCALVLTERGSTDTLDAALAGMSGVHTLFVDAAYEEGHAGEDLGLEVSTDQLAYIYFTSGSTGQPKGAMCEQAGMLNHLFAKIDDLGIVEGTVVAQTAPQCFDISLWQLVSALLVGGRTVIVEQAAILDAERFVARIAEHEVAVMQVVPSYLEALLTYLERHPRELAELRCVSVTGEALKRELAQRWFALEPGIKLANAYGLTETSDDTNHEVMDRAPGGDRVPLGRPVGNVRVYVVDERLAPVPLGAMGEIVFSGVCVGRGYINDPERTRAAFMGDPHRAGERLYRSGDYGRWRPDGKLEFLGRRDGQVKIRGFRIELGEIENTLLRVPGVRDGAVVVTGRTDESRQLVAFYTGEAPLSADRLHERLSASLPHYMVPSACHWRASLPLTANSKIDKQRLRALADELEAAGHQRDAPLSATERRLAAAWTKVLGIPQDELGRGDHFFDRGGTSLSAVKLAVALDRAVTIKDITAHPVLADLAALVDARTDQRSGEDVLDAAAAPVSA